MTASVTIFIISLASTLAWLWLTLFRSGFWRVRPLLERDSSPEPNHWPGVTVIIPARNEAEVIGQSLRSLVDQDYQGDVSIVLVDDCSDDGTGAIASRVVGRIPLTVLDGKPLEPGWTGKLFAMNSALERSDLHAPDTQYYWFTDADIVHEPDVLSRLIKKAEGENKAVVSTMVCLNSSGFWGALLVPAFVFFFQKLYPFEAVNNPSNSTAGAAGGVLLVNRDALVAAGGLEGFKGALIDDCGLAKKVKQLGYDIWLGHTVSSRSIRRYTFLDFWQMVGRTGFSQLGFSFLALIGALLGLGIIYLWPWVMIWTGLLQQSAFLAIWGVSLWLGMAAIYFPSLKRYRNALWSGLVLPFTAAIYALMTLNSAVSHYFGRGGGWKGRIYQWR